MGEQPRIPAESQSLNVLPTFGAPRVHRSVVLNPVPTDISQTEQQLLHPQVLSAGLPFGLLGLQPPGDSMLGLADVAPAFGGGLAGQSLTTMPGAISEDARKEAAAAARAARQQKRKEEKQRRDEKQRKQQPTFNNTASTEYNGQHPAGIMPSEVEHAAPLPGIGPSVPGPTMIQTSSIPPLMQMTSSPVVPQGLPLPIPIAAPLKAPAAPKDKSAARAIKNRESAARSRARRVEYTTALEAQVEKLREQNKNLRGRVICLAAAPPDPHAGQLDGKPLRRTRTMPL